MKPVIVVALLSLGILMPHATAGKPNAPFSLSIQPVDAVLQPGAPVRIRITLTNTSAESLQVGGAFNNMTGIDTAFEFDVRDGNGKPPERKKYKHPELASYTPILGRTLKPGAAFTEEQNISRLYEFNSPGVYWISVSRSSSPRGSGPMIRSNTITITVTIAPEGTASPQPRGDRLSPRSWA